MCRCRWTVEITLLVGGGLPQLLVQKLVHYRWIGLSLRRLHHLTDKEADHGLLARAVLLQLPGIGGDHLVDDLLYGGSVGKLLGLLLLVDRGKIFASLESQIVKLFEHLAADGAAFDQVSRHGNALHRNR